MSETITAIIRDNKELFIGLGMFIYGFAVGYYKGYLAAYQEVRKEVRALCHSERWQCPDFDKDANIWLA